MATPEQVGWHLDSNRNAGDFEWENSRLSLDRYAQENYRGNR